MIDALEHAELERPGDPLLDRAEAVFTILEHEAMHQETLLYMWHRLPLVAEARADRYRPRVDGASPRQESSRCRQAARRSASTRDAVAFGWDNEHPALSAQVPAFSIYRHDVTNAQFLEFVQAGGYRQREWWRAEDWEWIEREQNRAPPFLGAARRCVAVARDVRDGAAAWQLAGLRQPGGSHRVRALARRAAADGSRISTRGLRLARRRTTASVGRRGRRPQPRRVRFRELGSRTRGRASKGASAWGIHDLVGNGWEWTSTPFAPFPGFHAMASYPEYSADFFDGEHVVMKGASPATARELLRPSFRNWFRARYPYVYATFRCVR